jgi:regulator of PEP synthase PpsR (kinase-PPPase family)
VAPKRGKEEALVKYFHLHLISDSTGETIQAVARAVCAQFVEAQPVEHIYGLVRGKKALDRALAELAENPGPVMYSILDDALRANLHSVCEKLSVPCLSVLEPFVNQLAPYLKVEASGKPGGQHAMDTDYFRRINALNYTIQHDDGQSQNDLDTADIILTGVSRTSKTPTCIYLANRGYKSANVPLVPGMDPPSELLEAKNPLIVGLLNSPERLRAIRRNRLLSLNEESETEYIDPELIRAEIADARRLFARQRWPVIDVTRRSVEEIASAVLNLYQDHEKARDARP